MSNRCKPGANIHAAGSITTTADTAFVVAARMTYKSNSHFGRQSANASI